MCTNPGWVSGETDSEGISVQEAVGGALWSTPVEKKKAQLGWAEGEAGLDELSMKASAEFMGSSEDRMNSGAVPSWEERPGLCKCPLPTLCPHPALERARPWTNQFLSWGRSSLKGFTAESCCPSCQPQRPIHGHELLSWLHFFKQILRIFKDSSLNNFFIIQCQQVYHLYNLTNQITALLQQMGQS